MFILVETPIKGAELARGLSHKSVVLQRWWKFLTTLCNNVIIMQSVLKLGLHEFAE